MRAHFAIYAVAVMAAATWAAPARAGSLGVEAGGGVADYTRGLNPQTSAGPAWNAGVTFRVTEVLGLEALYTGSSVDYDAGGVTGNIRQDGAAGLVRLNLATSAIRPFVFGGLGGAHVRADGAVPLESDTLLTVPAGAGVELSLGDVFSINGRVRYDFLLDSTAAELVSTSPDADREGFDRLGAFLSLSARL